MVIGTQQECGSERRPIHNQASDGVRLAGVIGFYVLSDR